MEKTLEILHNLADQGHGDDTVWEVIDRLDNESDAEEIGKLKRFARELKRQQAAEKIKIKSNETHRCPICGKLRNKGYIYMYEEDLGVNQGIHEKAITGLCPDCYKQIE